eukprot:scaffold975_cov398-Prasinococcus_capsulatus_cf.AAC.10
MFQRLDCTGEWEVYLRYPLVRGQAISPQGIKEYVPIRIPASGLADRTAAIKADHLPGSRSLVTGTANSLQLQFHDQIKRLAERKYGGQVLSFTIVSSISMDLLSAPKDICAHHSYGIQLHCMRVCTSTAA